MTDTLLTEQNRVTVGYTLKVPVKGVQYASEECTIFLPRTVPEGATTEQITALGHEALSEARQIAATHLGIEVGLTYTDDGIEKAVLDIQAAFPGTTVERSSGGSRGGNGGGGQQASGGGATGSVKVKSTVDAALPDWLDEQWQALVDAGKIDPSDNELWDNRKFSSKFGGTGNAKAPWFKTKKADVPLDFGGNRVDPSR